MGGPLTTVVAWGRAVLLAPFGRRARNELLFCLAGIPLGLVVAGAGVWLMVVALFVLLLSPSGSTPLWVGVAAFLLDLLGLALVVLLATRIARRLGAVHRRLAARLLGTRVAPPPPPARRRGRLGWLAAGLGDGPGWRAVAYQLLKLPLAFLEAYAVFWWAGGLANLTYPFWWGLFRNQPPGVTLGPVPVLTPFPGRALQVATFPGSFLALAVGLAMVLAAPWVTRAVVAVDRRLLVALLGPGRLALRVRDLEHTRALAVDDAAAQLRRVERDLHDGAQIRLATLAMHLGLATESLAEGGGAPDLTRVRELVDAAHRDAKQALGELRDLARGIHPPVLDSGLDDALSSWPATCPSGRPRRSRRSPTTASPSCWPTRPSTATRPG
jgi:signal transduction histidine kinase